MKFNNIKSLLLLIVISTLAACGSTSVSDDATETELKPVKPVVLKESSADKGFDPVVYFDFDKSVIKQSEASKISGQAEKIKKDAPKSITVEGHTDAVGTKEYNIALGERRANSTKKALAQKGINQDNIEVISYGKERLMDTSNTKGADSYNRRTVTILNK